MNLQRETSRLLENRRVLVVDDESLVLMLIEDMLIDLGADGVETATGIDAAVRIVENCELDFAVLDVNLCGRRSYPIASALQMRSVPFLFATGYGSSGHEPDWRGRPTLAKPFSARDLARAISALLPTSASKS